MLLETLAFVSECAQREMREWIESAPRGAEQLRTLVRYSFPDTVEDIEGWREVVSPPGELP